MTNDWQRRTEDWPEPIAMGPGEYRDEMGRAIQSVDLEACDTHFPLAVHSQ